jgi:CubicO group peptidase (beta-lactamase class C family)
MSQPLFAVAVSLSFLTAQPASVTKQLNDLVQLSRQSHSSQLYIVRNDKVLVNETAKGADALVSIQSITKNIVSLAIGNLIEQGKIGSVDDLACTYLKDFDQGPQSKVTIRHILTHRKGIDAGRNFGLDVEDAKDFLRSAMEASFDSEPGEKFAYNNKAVQLAFRDHRSRERNAARQLRRHTYLYATGN